MVAKRPMAVANSEEVLPSFPVDVGIDEKGVLVDFGRIAGNVSLLGPIRKPHHVFEKVLLHLTLRLDFGTLQVLSHQIHNIP